MLEKNIIMISRDALIMKRSSEVRKRIESYGNFSKALHVLIVGGDSISSEVIKTGKNKNVFLYHIGKSSVWSLFKAYLKSKKIIKLEGEDNVVVTVQDPFETGFVGMLLKNKFNIGLQVQIHTDFLSPFFKKESFKNIIRVFIASFVLPLADSVRVVSERIRKSIIEKYDIDKEKIRVIPISVDINRGGKSIKIQKDKFVILMASRLTKEKNIDMAIKSFEGVARRFDDVLLVVVGDGPEKSRLMRLVSSLGLEEKVRFEGWRDDLSPYFKRADLYLLTSLYEGYGRTVIEVVNYKVPVVMTDVGVAGEIIKDKESGRVVPVHNRILLERVLVDLIKSDSLRKEYSEKALSNLNKKSNYLEEIEESLNI